MLRGLEIRDILLIDRLALEFQPGLNVLTGETGAGKSILLDSLGFVLGWRGRADLVRTGAERGEVTAVFELGPDHPARAVLEDAGLPVEEELVLRRTNARDGRKTARVNDSRVSGEVLRRLSDSLVELHGQHDDRGLLDPRGHGPMLDVFAGHGPLLQTTRSAWSALAAARRAEAAAKAELAAARAEEDWLRHAVDELDTLAPEPGEEAELDTRRRAMQGAERVRGAVAEAAGLAAGEGAETAVLGALRRMEDARGELDSAVDPAIAALERALDILAEAQAAIAAVQAALEVDPVELDAAEERLFALRALARKHGVLADDLAGLADTLRARLAALDQGADALADRAAAVHAAEAAYTAAAQALHESRQAAAARLDAAMAAELAPLKMERAVFRTALAQAAPGPSGHDAVSFTVATNPGAPSGPLDRIASGGELSRFLLALKVCLTRDATDLTLIFDEIDRGVGGATAAAIGRRLATLAGAGGQVLAVTHSPQVAALARHHWRVQKRIEGEVTLSTVEPLGETDRIDEIARMLSGDTITEPARDAARALLAS